jgi:hypothetical protein
MTVLLVQPPYPLFTDTAGQPLDNGYVWVGEANLAPQTNPISVYWDADLTQQASQPLRTSGGYIVNAGTPAVIYTEIDYSILVQNSKGNTVYSALETTIRNNNTGNGTWTSDYPSFQAAYNATPEGGNLYVDGIVDVTSPLNLTRRVSVICPSPSDALFVNVGSGNDAVTFQGTASGINNITLRLNVYGPANACNNAVVLSRVDRSEITLNVRAGALAYAVVLDGILENKITVYSSINWAPPVPSYGTQVDHVYIQRNDTYGVAPNINLIHVVLEGCRNGITTPGVADPGVIPVSEGGNTISGTIQGLSGRAIDWYQSTGLTINNLWLEANLDHSVFDGCRSLRIGPGVQGVSPSYPGGRQLQFLGCQNVVVDGFQYGQLLFDALCSLPVIRNALVYTEADIIAPEGFYNGGVTYPVASLSDATIAFGGAGVPSMENLHTNPFLDIWYWNGSALQPQDVTGTNCTLAQGAIAPSSYSDTNNLGATPNLSCTLTVAGVNNGVYFNLPTRYINQLYNRWMSFSIPVFLQTGSANARVYVNGTLVSTVTTKNTWVVVRGSAIVPALGNFSMWITRHDGTNFVTSNAFAVGGVSICYGPHSPKNIVAGPNRQEPASAVRAFRSTQLIIGVSTDTIIPYDTVETDLLGEYNSTTGVFTAKYDGLYSIAGGGSTTLVAWNATNQFNCAITINGTRRAIGTRGYQWITTFGAPNLTMTKESYPNTVIYITAGSTVSIVGFSDRATDAYNFAIVGGVAGTGAAASTFMSITRLDGLLVI